MAQEEKTRKGLLGLVAKVFNTSGSVMVSAYDASAGLVAKTYKVAKSAVPAITPAISKTYEVVKYDASAGVIAKTYKMVKSATPAIPSKATKLVAGGLSLIKRSEKKSVTVMIKEYEDKINSLYYEIGKAGASGGETDSGQTKVLIEQVKEYEKEIERLKARVVQMEEDEERQRKKERKKEKAPKRRKGRASEAQVCEAVKAAIDQAVKKAGFAMDSDRAIFAKIASDLLDPDMELKTLAASELGKLGNKAAIPVLIEAASFANPYLSTEIVNALIHLQATESADFLKELLSDPEARVRTGSLLGVYKLLKDEEALPLLRDALQDDSPEARRSAITYLGWKDDREAVPGLILCLQDLDEKVRKAAVSALAGLKDKTAVLALISVLTDKSREIREKALEAIRLTIGQEVIFDIHAEGTVLADAVERLKEWWKKERYGSIESVADMQPEAGTQVRSEVRADLEPEGEPEIEEAVVHVPEEAATEVETVPAAAVDTSADARFDELDEGQLHEMASDELRALCKERSLSCDEAFSKIELINLLLGKEE